MEKTVLIIDDELDLRELLKLTLVKMSIAAVAVETVNEAKAELKQNHFDLCLTDMRLPDGNGLDLVAWVQKHHPQLPIADRASPVRSGSADHDRLRQGCLLRS